MDLVADRYELLAEVAIGGMGVVYRAHDRQTGATVALKRLRETDRETVARFAREAEILAGLGHPAIVRYVAHGSEGAAPFLVMEWVAGETLQDRLDRARLSVAESVMLGRRLAGALEHAHQHGVIHRDIKPSNVILNGDELDQAVLVDFGIARSAVAGTSVTATGALVGTPAYMSPEQARGSRDLTSATDVYGLGCLLYECMTGQRAFAGKHALALLAKVVLWEAVAPARLNPAIPPQLEALVMQTLAKLPSDRPTDRELADRLAAVEVSDHVALPPPAVPRPPAEVTARISARQGSIVIATSPEGADGSGDELDPAALSAREAVAHSLIDEHRVRAVVLRDGSLVALVEQPARAGAQLALACARAISRQLPELLVAISAGDLSAPAAYESTVAGLAKEAMARLFGGVAKATRPEHAIRVDAETEQWLDDPIVRVGNVAYVDGRA